MSENKLKDGVSIKEIEAFTKKHRFEVILCAAFILACLFSFVMWGTGKSIIAATLGSVGGILLSARVEAYSKKAFHFIFNQEKTTQLVLGGVFLVLAIFLPPLYFLLLGLHGGKSIHHMALEMHNRKPS